MREREKQKSQKCDFKMMFSILNFKLKTDIFNMDFINMTLWCHSKKRILLDEI